MFTTTSGNRFNTSKPKMSNIPCSFAPPSPSIRKPTESLLMPSLSASHKSPGPPSHLPEKIGHTLALGHSPSLIHPTHLLPLTHNKTNHTPEGLPPRPCNTTSRNPLAVAPPTNTQLPLHLNGKSLLPSAPGNLGKSARTLTPLAPPFISPLPHKSTHSLATPTHHTHLPPKHTKHATGNYNSTLESYNLPNPSTNSTSPHHTHNLKTGATLS